jgi:hypothetical protein
MKTKNAILFLLIITVIFLFLSCGGGGGSGETPTAPAPTPAPAPPAQANGIPEWVIKGDSMAFNLANYWQITDPSIENDGLPCYAVDMLPPDNRVLNKVVIMAGVNGWDWKETTDQIIQDYKTFYTSLNAMEIICITVPKITYPKCGEMTISECLIEIEKLNVAITGICKPEHTVDTWAMPFTSDDGLHPDAAMNALIEAKILEMDAAL